jgi:hypothetical protein
MAVKTTRYRRHMVASGSFGCSWAATKWTRTPDQILVSPVVASSRNSGQTFKPDQRHAKKLKRTPGSYKVTASWPSPSRSRRNRCRANWPVPPTFCPLGGQGRAIECGAASQTTAHSGNRATGYRHNLGLATGTPGLGHSLRQPFLPLTESPQSSAILSDRSLGSEG